MEKIQNSKILETASEHFKPEQKQSIRTTFKLPSEAVEVLKGFAKKKKITIKELLDVLCNEHLIDATKNNIEKGIMGEKDLGNREHPIRKTYVISRYAFNTLNTVSNKLRISRDNFLEYLIKFYELLNKAFKKIIEDSIKNHPKALDIISELETEILDAEAKLNEILISEDPIIHRFGYLALMINKLIGDIETELSNGTPIDPYAW